MNHEGLNKFVGDVLCIILIVLAILVFFVRSLDAQQSFDTQVVLKLSEMLNVPPPTRILIERVSEKELIEDLKKFVLSECMAGRPERFLYCHELSQIKNVFVHGVWLNERPDYLHVKLYKYAGIEALIHEFCHWYLQYRTKPPGVINNHLILLPLVTALLTSDDFVAWLEGK